MRNFIPGANKSKAERIPKKVLTSSGVLEGFTLIELLVVIVIITILASVVLVTYPTVQDKAKDSRIISGLSQARNLMLLAYSSNGNYDNFTTTSPAEMVSLTKEVVSNGGILQIARSTGGINTTTSCLYSNLNVKLGSSIAYFCIDSLGYTITTTTNPGTSNCKIPLARCPGTP